MGMTLKELLTKGEGTLSLHRRPRRWRHNAAWM